MSDLIAIMVAATSSLWAICLLYALFSAFRHNRGLTTKIWCPLGGIGLQLSPPEKKVIRTPKRTSASRIRVK
jgi:hypothetical protein